MNDEKEWKEAIRKLQEELDRVKKEAPQFPRCCPTCGKPKDGGMYPYGPWWQGPVVTYGGHT